MILRIDSGAPGGNANAAPSFPVELIPDDIHAPRSGEL
jgi:hypothetical protein